MSISRRPLTLLVILVALGWGPSGSSAATPQDARDLGPVPMGDDPDNAYAQPFFPGADHDPAIPTAESILGQPVGSRLARPDEITRIFRIWGEASPAARVTSYGRTHEGRELIHAVISSPENLERLDSIRASIARLADPRGLSESEAETILRDTPAVAWLGYSIHGDETSGADASLAVAYHLLASRTPEVAQLLDRVVIVMDPCMNPDGRARIGSQIEQSAGYVANLDYASMHRGRWPYGRGNHYLFDMNRDWMVGACPETRGRWSVLLDLPPQLLVDAHEMGGMDTFLFYPQAKPLHPALPKTTPGWQKVFGADHAAAFDRYGWGYYTREWADAWGVFYSDAWGSLNGAVGMLYEQGGIGGQPMQRESGEIVSYREAVHGQAVASLANLMTLAMRRADVLADYLRARRNNVDPEQDGAERAFVVTPGRTPDREARFLRILLDQRIEVWRAEESFVARELVTTTGATDSERELAAGAWIVPVVQPQSALVRAYLDFDPRPDSETLLEERRSLERKGQSKVYDVTAWDLGRAFDLDAVWCSPEDVRRVRIEEVPAAPVGVVASKPAAAAPAAPYAWLVDGAQDRSVRFAARAMQLGLQVHLADKEFRAVGRSFPVGSLLLRRHENPADVASKVERAARDAGVQVFVTTTGRSNDDGPDLGGGHFVLLSRPRVALLGNAPVRSDAYGHIWHLLDAELRMPVTLVDAQELGSYDLRRYNVLVVPPATGLARTLEPHAEALAAWVRSGGTLIACGSSAGALTGDGFGLSDVVLRRNALEDLELYARAAERERGAREIVVDEEQLWDAPSPPAASGKEEGAAADEDAGDAPDEEQDAWMRRFSPSGVILKGLVDRDDWITAGAGAVLPVFYSGSRVLLARGSVETAVRLAPAAELRLGGLLWPEARERIADSAWLTVESVGNGQVILFAAAPAFRATFLGNARLLANAVVYGPGAGSDQPSGW